jgi:hypothetical protein
VRRDRLELAAMLAPYLVGLAGLVFLPALVTLWLAFTEYDLLRAPDWIGLGNFRELWRDDVFWTAVRNSLGFIAWAVPIRLVGAVALGLLLFRGFRGAAGARTGGLRADGGPGRCLGAHLAVDLQPAVRAAEPDAGTARGAVAVVVLGPGRRALGGDRHDRLHARGGVRRRAGRSSGAPA